MECVYCAVRTESSKFTLILFFKVKHVTNSAQYGRNVVKYAHPNSLTLCLAALTEDVIINAL
jgi:hypothetical protein